MSFPESSLCTDQHGHLNIVWHIEYTAGQWPARIKEWRITCNNSLCWSFYVKWYSHVTVGRQKFKKKIIVSWKILIKVFYICNFFAIFRLLKMEVSQTILLPWWAILWRNKRKISFNSSPVHDQLVADHAKLILVGNLFRQKKDDSDSAELLVQINQ